MKFSNIEADFFIQIFGQPFHWRENLKDSNTMPNGIYWYMGKSAKPIN